MDHDMHETPDRSAARPERHEPSRRDLLERALELGAVVWAAGVAVPAAVFLWPAGSAGPGERYLDLDVADMQPNSGRVVLDGGKPILVVRKADGEFIALSAVCTHLGCLVHWSPAERHILCPCHAAVFSADGDVVSGPPPRALAVYPTRMVAERLRIQT
jgi:cytochrome b6-f complex iron-sulfur subunit